MLRLAWARSRVDEKGKAMVGCAGLTLRRTARRAPEALETWDPTPHTLLTPARAPRFPEAPAGRVPGLGH